VLARSRRVVFTTASRLGIVVPDSQSGAPVLREACVPEALVLNASYEPLGVVPARRAVVLLLSGRASAVAEGTGRMRGASVSVAVPSVVRLTRYVRVPYRATVPLTRNGVLARDGHRCVYCNSPATSLDHVVPRSRGGRHDWTNVVAACSHCNHRKADRTLAELGWRLPGPPTAPTGVAWRILGSRRVDPGWRPWLGAAGSRPGGVVHGVHSGPSAVTLQDVRPGRLPAA
jgi:5-methylcytosine-specific restriction endonuclease McrA